jgi:hypothetical protein
MKKIYTFPHFFTQKRKIFHLKLNYLQVLANIFGLYYNYGIIILNKQAIMLFLLV